MEMGFCSDSFRVGIRVGIRVRLWKEMALMAGGRKHGKWNMEGYGESARSQREVRIVRT